MTLPKTLEKQMHPDTLGELYEARYKYEEVVTRLDNKIAKLKEDIHFLKHKRKVFDEAARKINNLIIDRESKDETKLLG